MKDGEPPGQRPRLPHPPREREGEREIQGEGEGGGPPPGEHTRGGWNLRDQAITDSSSAEISANTPLIVSTSPAVMMPPLRWNVSNVFLN